MTRCISMCLVAMAAAPLTKAFVAPGSSLSVSVLGREGVTRSCSKASARGTSSTSCRMTKKTETEGAEGDKKKTKPPAWMFNDDGVAYAPWMVDAFDPENLAKVAASIEARKEKEANTVPEALGALARDPQQMELSGAGLSAKRVSDEMVELTWKTGNEEGNIGFIVSRRAAKTDEWQEIASYKDFPPLNSKGPGGGIYTYADDNVDLGTWVYRISDISKSGVKSDLCQTLIELQSGADELQTKIGVAGLAIVLIAAAAAGTFIDPFAS
ncbi:conserved unknown protein [Ectocarpus siliculosus]|uniref:Uncharacterized protein n=1 Tax=Ectocarpus siliculosus TaxID=2880 RepID=D7FJQ9_ECTSI|nr:conserved unknown protein [Ectocarpus siliculosus]|eukprot:CBJ29161.1 conserved unknown protein [Ectocarpus siliculosus]